MRGDGGLRRALRAAVRERARTAGTTRTSAVYHSRWYAADVHRFGGWRRGLLELLQERPGADHPRARCPHPLGELRV
jgi:hypothetical protein